MKILKLLIHSALINLRQTNKRNNQSHVEQRPSHLPSDSICMIFWKRKNGALIIEAGSVVAWAVWVGGGVVGHEGKGHAGAL